MKTYIRKISPYLFLRLGMSGVYSVITAAIPFIIKLLLDGNYLNPKGITTLAGGYLGIVILLKAIASGKNLLILDEALSAVDRELSEYMTDRILEMKDKTVIAVTHNCSKEHLAKYDFQIELKGGKRKE